MGGEAGESEAAQVEPPVIPARPGEMGERTLVRSRAPFVARRSKDA